MRDRLIAFVRTAVPMVVAGVLTALGRKWGWLPSDEIVEDLSGLIVAGVGAAYYAVARWIEARWPKLGGILLGYPSAPQYPKA